MLADKKILFRKIFKRALLPSFTLSDLSERVDEWR